MEFRIGQQSQLVRAIDGQSTIARRSHLIEHRSKATGESAQLAEGLLQDRRERQESKRVTSGRRVKHDH